MANATENRTLLTTREMVAHLRISRPTLARWVREGRVPAIRLTERTLRFNPVAVAEALGMPVQK